VNHCPPVEWFVLREDGELPPERERQLFAHAQTCPQCSRSMREHARLAELMRETRNALPSNDALAQLRETLDRRYAPPVVRTLRALSGIAAAILLTSLAGLCLLGNSARPPHPALHVVQPELNPEWENGPLAVPTEHLNPFDPRGSRGWHVLEGDL
jgi:anti-sigma factor RsiW